MVPIRQNLVSPDRYWLKCPYPMKPTRIVVHNTGNDAPAKNEVSYMVRNDNEVSYHVAVDDVEIVQGIPFDRNAWNAGDGNGKGNREGIGIEICYSASGGARFVQAAKPAAQWADNGIATVKQEKIMVGDSESQFRPQSFITRQEVAVVAAAILKKAKE